jgi:hypothetical protein
MALSSISRRPRRIETTFTRRQLMALSNSVSILGGNFVLRLLVESPIDAHIVSFQTVGEKYD